MKTILKLKHATKEDLFCVVNGNVAKAYDVAETYKAKGYTMKEATPAKMCIYKGVECAIVKELFNYYVVLHLDKEEIVTKNQIELL